MKRGVIRAVIILATISILGLSITQLYWLKKAFDLNEDQFNRDVNTALYNVASQLFEINRSSPSNINPIEQLSTNYYIVTINNEIDAGMLEFLLKNELTKRDIQADFEYGIYDCNNDKMVYGNYVSFDDQELSEEEQTVLPKWSKQQYYFGVYFPNKEFQIINRMGIWVFSTAVLFIVILFFTYASFVILKQKRLSEVQKDFINNMTHEFKTPISTISLSAEVLKDPAIVVNPERLTSYASIIQSESLRLKNQVDRVLQIASLEDEQVILKREIINVHEILKEITESLHPKIESLKGSISIDLNATKFNIKADKLHISNVFYNLIDNAIKYCGKIPLEVTMRTSNKNRNLIIEVIDNGIGIAKKERKKIFDKFYRVSTGNIHDVKGFGLGLHYVNLIINAHGGSIELVSSPTKGSNFIIKMPLNNES